MHKAGVVNGDLEGTGNACTLASCVIPSFKSEVAQKYLGCQIGTNCHCSGLKSEFEYSTSNLFNMLYQDNEEDLDEDYEEEESYLGYDDEESFLDYEDPEELYETVERWFDDMEHEDLFQKFFRM